MSWLALLRKARKLSYRDGRLRFVQRYAVCSDKLRIGLRRNPNLSALWTNGSQCGTWQAGASQGVAAVRKASDLAEDVDPWCAFDAFGTCRTTPECTWKAAFGKVTP